MTNRIVEDMPPETYHAGAGTEQPSASAGVLRTLLAKTPLHAWTECPQLNPLYEAMHKTQFDLGSALHAMLLGGANLRLIDHDTYHTKAAKQARDDAYADGKTPLLAEQWEKTAYIADRARQQITAHPDVSLAGKPEVSMIWRDSEFGCWCRARPDFLLASGDIYDVKLTGVFPSGWEKQAFNMGYDLRVGHYLSGVLHCMPAAQKRRDPPQYLFLNVEKDPPHSVFVTALNPDAIDMAIAKAREATRRWADCLVNDKWPGWEPTTYYYSPPPWIEAEWQMEQFNGRIS